MTSPDPHDERPTDEGRPLPTTDHPLHGERRPTLKPALAVLGVIVLVALIVFVLTVVRYAT